MRRAVTKALHQGRTALYRFFDDRDVLLYVGISNTPRARWKTHEAKQPWWPDVTIRELEWHDTRAEAERAETAAISAEGPRWNIAPGMPDYNDGMIRGSHRPKKPWALPPHFGQLLDDYESAGKRLGVARDSLESAIVAEMRKGVSAHRIAKVMPFSEPALRKLARDAGIPRLSAATVVSVKRAQQIPH
jgi:GIY-YIG catalytic domain